MRIKKLKYYSKLTPIAMLLIIFTYGFVGDNKNGKQLNKSTVQMNKVTSGKVGDGYRININNLNVPVNNAGIIAEVTLPDGGNSNGYYGAHEFLFAGGFFLSGTRNGSPWANAVASATLVEDYVPGTIEGGTSDPRAQLYVLNSSDEPFGQSWQDWKDAVDLGADFYDGDGDGIYSPSDKNGNGTWDADEDAPDIVGDETVWCVYNDGLPAAQRRWNTISPMGIEIRQTIFGFASAGNIGNLLFVRYRIKYVGLNKPDDPESLKDVYFGVWADPDVGEQDGFGMNLVGCDTVRNAGYTYLNQPSPTDWGNQPPCFIIDFFSGPAAYIPGVTYIDNNGNGMYDTGDTPLDSASSVRGNLLGTKYFPGARNQPLSSFVEYINGDPVLNDPDNATQARNLILGLSRTGEVVDPCSWSYGVVEGVNCSEVDPRFWYSGDPVTNIGWINTAAQDIRQMSNTGPFELKKGEESEIVVAYVVGQGNSPLNSISVAKSIDDGAQYIFDHNFQAAKAPPPVTTTRECDFKVEAGEDFIDLTWNTAPQFNFYDSTQAYQDYFQGYKIFAYQSNTNAPTVDNRNNRILYDYYTVDNFIKNVWTKNSSGGYDILYEAPDTSKQLDSSLYGSENGRLRIRITEDPFTGGPLIKGKPYYFSIVGFALNEKALLFKDDTSEVVGTEGDYLLNPTEFFGNVENIEQIINSSSGGIVMGEELYDPPYSVQPANQLSGYSDGYVGYDIVKPDDLTGDKYIATFLRDSSSESYKMLWSLENATTNQMIIDSSSAYTYGSQYTAGTVYDGFIPRIKALTPTIGTSTYYPTLDRWYVDFHPDSGTGVFYVGKDIPQGGPVPLVNSQSARSSVIYADDLRNVEIRFGETGKAYRYLNGYVPASGFITSKKITYYYAGGVVPTNPALTNALNQDPTLLDDIGKLGEGFVDVPFTAWIVDEKHNETRQLAVAFIEMSTDYGHGKPDGIWNPTNLDSTDEVIVVFNSDYDPNGNQIEYTGGDFNGTQVWGDIIRGFTIPQTATGISDEQKAIAKSPWFNTLYVAKFKNKSATTFYTDGDKLTIPVSVYPYTTEDVFEFTTRDQTNLTENESAAMFERVNVFPNPLFGFNPATSYNNTASDDAFVTFSNLPEDITIAIYSLSGNKIKSLSTNDKSAPTSPFLRWDLKNDSGVRVASGLYIAIVTSPKYGQKILKFSIIMPQKQLQKY